MSSYRLVGYNKFFVDNFFFVVVVVEKYKWSILTSSLIWFFVVGFIHVKRIYFFYLFLFLIQFLMDWLIRLNHHMCVWAHNHFHSSIFTIIIIRKKWWCSKIHRSLFVRLNLLIERIKRRRKWMKFPSMYRVIRIFFFFL